MSETGVAPRIVIDAPLPRAPLHGITGSPAAASIPPDNPRWMAGADMYPFPDAMPDSVDPCGFSSPHTKLDPEGVTIPDPSLAFTAYLGEICHSAGIGPWDAFKDRANRAMNARASWALERQLAWGAFADGPFLGDADVDLPAGSGAVAAASALAWLDGYLARQGQQGVIHITPEVATFLGDHYLIADGINLRTRSGTPVIVGTGYSDQAGGENFAPTGGSEAAGGQSWCFASSPVLYRLSPEPIALPESLAEALNRENNEVVYRAELDMWVAFDGGPHAAVLADWTP